MEKVYMIAYDEDFMPSEEITSDGLAFKYNKPFFMICNKALSGKMYFEITIDDYYPIAAFHNIPIYLGISREPSFGALNADFCIGALYYENGKEYDIQEKYNASGENLHWSPSNIYTRIPGASDIIGVGVDTPNNTITLYNNGKAFYSFSPKQFTISSHTFYFCLYSNTWYEEISYDDRTENDDKANKFISGHINFGKTNVEYCPPGYTSIYGWYYKRISVEQSLLIDANVEFRDVKNKTFFLDIDCTNILDTITDKTLRLISNNGNVNINDMTYEIFDDPSIQDNLLYGANVFINLPIPTDVKIYFEFTATQGTVDEGIIGIPLSLGLSNINTSILSRSLRLHLYHTRQMYYQYAVVESFIQNVYEANDVETTVVPSQGKLIGVEIDLANNQFTVYIDTVKFYTLKSTLIDFSNRLNKTYFFIHDDGVFSNSVIGSFNLGQEPFDMTMPDGCTSLVEYYNRVYRQLFAYYMTINCRIYNDRVRGASLWIDGWVDSRNDRPSPEDYGNLAFLLDSYNSISDTERHITNDITSLALNAMIASDNNGYYPSINDYDYSGVDYDDNGDVTMYGILIRQSEYQTIEVIYNGTVHTDSFEVPEGTSIQVRVVAEAGYDPGEPQPSSQIVVSDTVIITATDATIHQYTVNITQTDHQMIYVTCNGRGYTSSFNTTYGSAYTVMIVPEDGYSAGTLNRTSGQITSDVSIYATPASVVMYPITIVQGQHYTIGVMCNGIEYTESFNAPFNSLLNIYLIHVDEGYLAPNITEPIITVKGPTTISYDDGGEDICTITVLGDYQGELLVNGHIGTVFAFRRGEEVTIEFTPADGYYLDSMELNPQ